MKRLFAAFCAFVMVLSVVNPAVFAAEATGAAANGAQTFSSLQAAVDGYADGVIVLNEDAKDLVVTKDVYLDLNGHDIENVTVSAGTLYCMDSETDDYTVADGVYGKLTGQISGNVAAVPEEAACAEHGYLKVAEEGAISFHCVNLKITAMALRASEGGVYYKSNFAGDELVAANVEAFGVALSIVAAPDASNLDTYCGYSAFKNFRAGEGSNSGNATGTLLRDIMKAANTDKINSRNANMPIYGRAYIKTAEGYLFGAAVKRSLKEQVEAIDAKWSELVDTQRPPISAMYEQFAAVMNAWNIPNIKGVDAPADGGVITIPVYVPAKNGVVTEEVIVNAKGVSITVPAGTKLAEGATKLTLTVTPKQTSDVEIDLEDSEVLMPMDVHVDGIAADNTAPLTIYLGKVMAENLNMGNYAVYHVENGMANEMELIAADEAFTAHNQYKYTLDGELTLYMATFSDVLVVSDEENKWNGDRNYDWYNTTDKILYIRNADQLAGFGAIVGDMAKTADKVEIEQDSFEGKTVILLSDIDLGDDEENNDATKIFYPIGYNSSDGLYEKTGKGITSGFYSFNGIFDGNGNTIQNIYQNTWEMKGDHNWYTPEEQYFRDGMGLFGIVYGGTVKNLTVKNFKSDGEITTTGVIAAYADSDKDKPATFENIAIFDCNPRVYNIGNGGIVGCAGWYSKDATDVADTPVTFKNITVDQTNKISALWGTYDVSCGGILGQYYPDSGCGLKFENCHVAAIIDVNNDVCANYQYYWYRYSGMLMGTVRANTKDESGYTVADTTGIEVTGCTYTYGAWNEYWYCELVKNSSASYTHDYQFGRLTNIDELSEIKSGETWLKEGNFALVSDDRKSVECYHIFKNSEGNLYRHFHDVADESNPKIYEDFDLNGDGELNDLKEDRQRYYLPFGQVLNGLGYGVKPTYTMEGFTLVEDGSVISGLKFAQKADAVLTYAPGDTIYLKDLVDLVVDESKLSQSSLYAAVSPATEDGKASATYSRAVENWENSYIVFSEDSKDAAKLVITDYFYCEPTVIILNPKAAEEKFTANSVADCDAYTQITLGDLFVLLDGATLSADVIATVTDPDGNEVTLTGTSDGWASTTIDLTKAGAWTVIIKENVSLCEATSVTFNVNKIEKFAHVFPNTDEYLYRVGNADTTPVKLSQLFSAIDENNITGTVSVTIEEVEGTAVSGTYTSDAAWKNGTINFDGTGVAKVTITDNESCIPTVLYLEVVDAVNATAATSATANNVVLLNDITSGFTVSGRYTVYGNGFTLNYTGNGQYLNNGLKQGVITVSENGTLDNLRIKATIYPAAYLYYGSNSFADAVQDGPSDGNNRYYYQLSAVAAKDNATISNCYIYGGRNNIFINTGDVTVKDTVLECGVVANVQIQSNSSHTITFENVTTIQKQVNPTMGDTSLVMLGAGVLVGPETTENPTIVLNGDFKQYNWVTADDASAVSNTMAQAIINGALNTTAYNHTVNGKTASNLGIIYMNTYEANVTNKTGLPYVLGDVSMTVSGNTIKGQVCSLQNATTEQIYSDVEKADRSTVNGLYQPQFKYSADLGGQYVAKTDDGDEHCYREGDTIHVMFPSGDTKELDLAALVDIQKYTGQDLNLVVTCKDSSGNGVTVTAGKVTLSDMDEYTVTYTVTDTLFFDQYGNKVEGTEEYSWDVTLSVSLKDTAVPDAEFKFNANSQKMGYYKPLIGDVKQYLPFLAGLQIYDYNGQTQYLRFDGDTDFNKVASVTITGYTSNEAYIEVKLTDGGVINTKFLARADSGGGSTYTGTIKTSNNIIYYVTDSGTSNKETTTTAAYWYVDYYKFTGNNGVAIQSAQQTFNSIGSSASTPSGSFSTTIKYTVSYDANEGNCGQTVGYATSASAAVTLPTPTRSGYMFSGWYTAASDGTRVGGAGESYTPSANITLYAQWGKPSTVTYNANGGEVTPTSDKYTGTALTLPTPTRDGYWFTGWYTAASGGNKIGDAGAAYNPTSGDITIYAQWSPIYTVTYNANGGEVSVSSASYTGTALTLPNATRDGYAFNGWYDAAEGGNKVGGAGNSYTPSANVTLYAQWGEVYTVTYNANGGTCGTASATYTGMALTLPTPTRSGYTFNGWYTAESGGEKIGDAGATYTPNADITLYAQWQINSYTIKVTTNNATVKVNGTEVSNNGTVSIQYGAQVTVEVTYSESDSQSTTIKGTDGTIYTSPFNMPAQDVTINATSTSCVSADTLVTLADGTQVRVDALTGTEELLVWNLETGAYDVAPIVFVDMDAQTEYEIIHLYFADGTDVEVIYEHGFFDVELGKYVYLDRNNAADYIGHSFIKQGDIAKGTWDTVELTDVVIESKVTTAYSPVTFSHLCYYVNGVLSMPGGIDGLFNIFDVDTDTMAYDAQKKAKDIATYGLFTYEDFADVIPEEAFYAFNGAYLKVAIGKGLLTWEDIEYLANRYMPLM